jgi:hypothetical protein
MSCARDLARASACAQRRLARRPSRCMFSKANGWASWTWPARQPRGGLRQGLRHGRCRLSQNLTEEKAAKGGARLRRRTPEDLRLVTIHLSCRSARAPLGAADLAKMKRPRSW